MDISVVDERAVRLREHLELEEAQKRAWERKVEAFGTVSRMTSFLQKPSDSDFELVYQEHRYQPFWHIACSAHYAYERTATYSVPVGGRQVRAVTIEGKEYPAVGTAIQITGTEHCEETFHTEAFIDGITNSADTTQRPYVSYDGDEMSAETLEAFGAEEGTILVPPRARASAVVRDVLIGLIKSFQADRILKDQVGVEKVDLYYRPVYAFRYRWAAKDREAVLEVDGLSGEVRPDGATFQQYVGKLVDPEFLFDIGAETVDLLVPGGGIAIKLARKGIEVARSRS